jgi:hypothetical protein
MSEGRRRVMEYVCQHHVTFRFVIYAGTVGILLDVVALATLEPGTSSYTVAVINLPGLIFFVGLSALLIRKCVEV